MRMKLLSVLCLGAAFGLPQFATAAAVHHNTKHEAHAVAAPVTVRTLTLFSKNAAGAETVLATVNVDNDHVADVANTRTFGYVASCSSNNLMEPGAVIVGYRIHASVSQPHHGEDILNYRISATKGSGASFVPVSDIRLGDVVQNFTLDGLTIQLPNVSSLEYADSVTLKDTADVVSLGKGLFLRIAPKA